MSECMQAYPLRLEREVRAEPETVYRAVAEMLRHQGYRLRETELLPPSAAAGFTGGFRAMRDTVPDAGRRRQGYWLLGAGVGITLVMLVVLSLQLVEDRFLASAPLLPAVILGGLGLGRLREPPQRIRRLVKTRVDAEGPSAAHLTLEAGVGHAEGADGVSAWADDESEPPLDTVLLDQLLERLRTA